MVDDFVLKYIKIFIGIIIILLFAPFIYAFIVGTISILNFGQIFIFLLIGAGMIGFVLGIQLVNPWSRPKFLKWGCNFFILLGTLAFLMFYTLQFSLILNRTLIQDIKQFKTLMAGIEVLIGEITMSFYIKQVVKKRDKKR
ncbi:hypothetical protein [Clostridium omnivorum]|uniref:Uncharacterized protein n=1 Tax=Clostridium omnivorum TaxID=1604902 RepID=A0ABQ5N7G8_9CLOT|nr:hypothetical protein [Clostridium sp. E14]GLC31178.1 hypothetical protein bsdE14_25880 [Clostridium sp. E14]